MNVKKMFVILWGGVRSIPINFKLFPFRIACRLPLIISPFVKIKSLKGKVIIKNCDIKTGMIRIGFGNVGIFDNVFSRAIIQLDGEVIFYGDTSIGHGSKISVGGKGILEIGKNFIITAETSIICHKKIKFGNNVLISWENLFMDTDFHKIKNIENNMINESKEIFIGNNVWIGCRNTILKGSQISDNSVIGSNSLINKKFNKNNILIAGNPAKILKENIVWEE